MKKQAGWTLIELMIVIILLGILSVSYMAKFFDISETSHKKFNEKVLSDLRDAITLYNADALLKGYTPVYPSTLDDAQLDRASESNSFFVNVLHYPGIIAGWEKIGAYQYRPLSGDVHTYEYNPGDGKFLPVD
jgi:prepilin-type N-terminal cleavage/methylation domain-containing protein